MLDVDSNCSKSEFSHSAHDFRLLIDEGWVEERSLSS